MGGLCGKAGEGHVAGVVDEEKKEEVAPPKAAAGAKPAAAGGSGGVVRKSEAPARRKVENVWKIYEHKKKLGNGGYGKVVAVADTRDGKQYAMKMMTKLRSGKDYTDRFWAEVSILNELDHPSILSFHDACYDEEYFYLVTELLSGGELLEHILKCHRFSERVASSLFHSILVAVEYLHSRDVVHLDLKPENYVFSAPEDGPAERILKLIDFGCAQKVKADDVSNVRTGTPYYIAPEMLSSKIIKNGEVLKACDMWSLGVILFILVTGKLPFYGESRKVILQAVANGVYEFPADLELSKSVKELIARFLEKDWTKRITIKEALKHSWVSDNAGVSDEPLNPTVLEGIKNARGDTTLKRALGALLVQELTEEDKEQLKKMFDQWDDNKDGVLQYEEVVGMVEKLGYDKQEALRVSKILVQEFDMDKDGKIDLTEFAAIGTRGMLALNDDFVNQLFDYLDRDGNGFASKEEIELYFAEHPNFQMEVDIMQLITEADLNKDGQISRVEFLAAMKSKEKKDDHKDEEED